MKELEQITANKVYLLLLTVNYVPILGDMNVSEGVEFGIHLLISVGLSIVFFIVLRTRKWRQGQFIGLTTLSCAGIGLLLYPTTLLSVGTPGLLDLNSILIWELGHLIFGLLLGTGLVIIDRRHTI